jgi:hypothetical protein
MLTTSPFCVFTPIFQSLSLALLAPRGTLPLAQVVAASPEQALVHKTAVLVVSNR